MRAFLDDVAYFLRTVPRSPGFFAVAVLTLALGIGANTAIFSVINAVLLRPLPFEEPDRLVRLFQTEAAPGNYPFTGPDYLDWQAENKTLEGMALFTWYSRVNVSGSGQPESALAVRTEADFFSVLGAEPLLGRGFESPIGKSFTMGGGVRAEVIGVVADVSVRGVRSRALPQAYLPFTLTYGDPYRRYVEVRAATPPASLLGAIRSHVSALDSTLAVMDPRTMDDVMADGMSDATLQTWLLGVFAVVASVLAAVGLYSVMAFLVAQRKHEIGVRMALGAGRAELLRLVLGHGTKLIVAGVAGGLAAAFALTRLIRGLLFGVEATDVPTFAVVSVLLVLVAVAACVIPARRATRVDPIVALRYE
jgi:hypothetical protein